MRYFDYEPVARAARIPPARLDEVRQSAREEFPHDDMLYELHVLRACMAVRDGLVTLEEILRRPEAAPKP